MKKTSILLGVVSAALLFSCKKELKSSDAPGLSEESTGSVNTAITNSANQFVPNELLIKFKKGTSETAKANVFAKINGNASERVLTEAMKHVGDNEGFYVVRTPIQALEAISKAKGLNEVEYAEPNYIYTHNATSNDPYFTNGSLWGMYGASGNQYGSQAAVAWEKGYTGNTDNINGNPVYVGIIDEGAMYNHEDLTGNFGNLKEISGNGKDDDGNKLVDDTYGWDFVSNDKTTYDGVADDHGTHVAGTIGAKGGNGKGVAGVCWNVRMISAKFLGSRGGTTANAIKAIDYITDLKLNRGLNIVATNNSWGGGGYSQALKDAITTAGEAGILFICAAGNDGRNIDQQASYPASYDNWNIISVAAITSSGSLASFSNYGQTSVDIGAPGSGIYSTVPNNSGKSSSYASYSGTSMATPHVTGAAALYAATNSASLSGLTPVACAEKIKNAILSTAILTPTPSLANKCTTGGRLDANGALSK